MKFRFYFHFDLAGFSSLVAGISSTGPALIQNHEAFISDTEPRSWLTLQFSLERELSLQQRLIATTSALRTFSPLF